MARPSGRRPARGNAAPRGGRIGPRGGRIGPRGARLVAVVGTALAALLAARAAGLPIAAPVALLLLAAAGALAVALALRARRRAPTLAALTPAEFERHVAELFARAGYEARRVGGSGDGGVDVRVRRGGRHGIVQCKRYGPRRAVGPAAIRELVGARAHERADAAWLATTGRLTAGARRLAHLERVRVLDAAVLAAWGRRARPAPALARWLAERLRPRERVGAGRPRRGR